MDDFVKCFDTVKFTVSIQDPIGRRNGIMTRLITFHIISYMIYYTDKIMNTYFFTYYCISYNDAIFYPVWAPKSTPTAFAGNGLLYHKHFPFTPGFQSVTARTHS